MLRLEVADEEQLVGEVSAAGRLGKVAEPEVARRVLEEALNQVKAGRLPVGRVRCHLPLASVGLRESVTAVVRPAGGSSVDSTARPSVTSSHWPARRGG